MLEKKVDSPVIVRRRWASSAPPLRARLMEKPSTTATHRHNNHHTPGTWGGGGGGEKGEGGGGGQHHTQYIRRLVDLRDELLSQEETGLARALDRLRLHSISNREAARYRLKIKDQAAGGGGGMGAAGENGSPRAGMSPQQHHHQQQQGGGAAGSPFPRPMLTTVEKFRQMRPQRRPPVIFPLQGKQLIESSPISTGNVTRSSTEEGSRTDTSSSLPPQRDRVEDTVKANLQRLIQPTSSIPNIGRKALRQESLELKSQSLQNMRNRVFKSTQSHLMSPFMLSGEEGDGGEGGADGRGGGGDAEGGELHLSPHAYKLGPMTDGDRINMEKLNQYYYIYCMPDTPCSSREGGERRNLPPSLPPQSMTPGPHGQRRGGGGVGGMKAAGGQKTTTALTSRRTSSERSHISRPFSDRSSFSLAVSSDTEVETSVTTHPRYRHASDPPATERMMLPIIHDNGEVGSVPGLSSPPRRQNGHDPAFVVPHPHHYSPDALSPERRRKRHIVIDMPHIIFNAATPDISIETSSNNNTTTNDNKAGEKTSSTAAAAAALQSSSSPSAERPGVLSKTLKQNEIRHRELQNLLEDVKELNKRTETLSTQAQIVELGEPGGDSPSPPSLPPPPPPPPASASTTMLC